MQFKTRERESQMLRSFVKYLSDYKMGFLDAINTTAALHPAYSSVLQFISREVRLGGTMHDAMMQKKRAFNLPTLYLTCVGEEIGGIDKTLLKASELVRYGDNPRKIEEILFYYSLGFMIGKTGLPILRSVRCLEDMPVRLNVFPYRKSLQKIGESLEGGHTLSGAMERSGKYFPKEVVLRLEVAEKHSMLGEELLRISKDIQQDYFLAR